MGLGSSRHGGLDSSCHKQTHLPVQEQLPRRSLLEGFFVVRSESHRRVRINSTATCCFDRLNPRPALPWPGPGAGEGQEKVGAGLNVESTKCPPSTGSATPVIRDELSPARKTTAPLISDA